MKKLFYFSLLGATLSTLTTPAAFAQGATPVVAALANGRDVSILLNKGQGALVVDTRSATLPAGRSILRFAEVPVAATIDKTSLQLSIDPAVNVLSQWTGTYPEFYYGLDSFVGQQVTLLRPQGSAGEKAVTGKLLRASKPVLLETAEGILYDPPGVWVLPKSGASDISVPGTVSTPGFEAFQWEVDAGHAGAFPVATTYLTKSLNWDARYTATLAANRDRLNLRGWIGFQNGTGASYPNAKLSLRDENGFTFPWTRPLTLDYGETQSAYISADVPVTESLIYAKEGDFATPVNGAHPLRSMVVENSTANGLGIYLPVGSLSLWQGSGAGLRLEQTPKWGGIEPGDGVAVPLGVEGTVTIDRYITSSKLLNPVTREIVVAWKVSTIQGSKTVIITDRVPDRFKLTDASLKPNSVENDQLRFEVTATATTPVEFHYTVDVPA